MEVKLHDIGEGMTEATINAFLVGVGEQVRADQPLVEVQTDKMTAEIPAPANGIIKGFNVKEGDTIRVGETVLIMGSGKASTAPKRTSSATAQKTRIMASPYTRKLAREAGIPLEKVRGSGPAGRIMDEDIHSHLQVEPPPQETPVRTEADSIPFRGRRKQIASKMVRSVRTIPHCTHFEEIDVTELLAWKRDVPDVSMGAFFIKALSICLKEFPIFNGRLDEEQECVHLQHSHHIGVAVDTEEGLIVPVIRHVEEKTLKDIQKELKALTNKALTHTLTAKEASGGTFTVSNVGPLGGSIGATPIINEPEVALISFHKTKKRPMVNESDEIVIRSMMNVSMSFDHRVADGGTAVRFTNRLRDFIEKPGILLMEMI
ncbi:Dihydrolipoamide acetyltransferase component of pyruvate dehydrogenase complex [Bacillus sp. 349Y]|nr:Dihydrolipoamide acetyltransferase component of pyruvate dehydrogenase complex [Bacillus sp. 349Y]